MPTAMEHELRAEAAKKFPHDKERQDAYVYGAMRKHGWKPGPHHSPPKHWRHWYWGKVAFENTPQGEAREAREE